MGARRPRPARRPLPSFLRRSGALTWSALGLVAALVASPGVAAQPPIAALDCARLGADDASRTLPASVAPRILALQGSVPFVTMAPFAAFLEAMGYPAERLAHPPRGERTLSSYVDARRFAGAIAWYYEHDGVMPVPIGHSQGGMVVIKALHALAGRDGPVPVWNPVRGVEEARTWIVDPRSGQRRDVTSLRVRFAAALATGSLPRVLLAQWDVLPLLHDVPDSALRFTGFAIPWDPIAGTGPNPEPFRPTGSADVRNVVLPAAYSHIRLPDVTHLAQQPATRAWIDAWRPGDAAAPVPADADFTNLLHAADLWHSVKRAWCEAAQARLPAAAGTAQAGGDGARP